MCCPMRSVYREQVPQLLDMLALSRECTDGNAKHIPIYTLVCRTKSTVRDE